MFSFACDAGWHSYGANVTINAGQHYLAFADLAWTNGGDGSGAFFSDFTAVGATDGFRASAFAGIDLHTSTAGVAGINGQIRSS